MPHLRPCLVFKQLVSKYNSFHEKLSYVTNHRQTIKHGHIVIKKVGLQLNKSVFKITWEINKNLKNQNLIKIKETKYKKEKTQNMCDLINWSTSIVHEKPNPLGENKRWEHKNTENFEIRKLTYLGKLTENSYHTKTR